MKNIPTIDLFAGAGGLSLGAEAAGADVRLMVDNDPLSVATAKRNADGHHGAICLQADVADLNGQDLRRLAGLRKGDPLLVVGGPPCQPFSKAAYWTDSGEDARYRQARARGEEAEKPSPVLQPKPDGRRSLLDEYWRLVSETNASAFVFENVASILHPRNREVIPNLLSLATKAGFHTRLVRANAVDFGVPQKRQRVFVLGARSDEPLSPRPTHSENDPTEEIRPAVTSGEALEPFSGPEFFEEGEVVTGKWAKHLEEIPPGWNYKHHTEWAGHPEPTFVAETRFWSFLLKLHPEKPSWTVAASPGPWTGPFHWEGRRLRTPEMAALQGFPANYEFSGSRRDRTRQIGNAVPPLLASIMVESVLEAVESESVAA